jgi:hypothetical protein
VTVIESIIKDLRDLPGEKLVEVAGFVHQLSEKSQQERINTLQRLHGSLTEEDGSAFEEAMNLARRIER